MTPVEATVWGRRLYQRIRRPRAQRDGAPPSPPAIQVEETLVFDFDSLEQKAAGGSADAGAVAVQNPPFAGVLRAADLLSRRILLLDVQLLDGASFLTHGPEAVRSILARTDSLDGALAVVARKPSLVESLRHLLLESDTSPVLGRFEFSCLEAFCGEPLVLAERLHARDSSRLLACPAHLVPRIVAAELQAAAETDDPRYVVDVPTGPFARLEQAWTSWIAEAAAGRIRVRQWTGGFDLAAALSERPVPPAVLSASDPAVVAARSYLADTVKRTDALAYLRGNPIADHAGQLGDWWMNAYFDALAAQHRTNWLRFRADPGTQDSLPRRRFGSRRRTVGRDGATIQFQGSLVSTLDDMPAPVYALLRHQARKAISDWQSNPSQRSSDELAYAVARADAVVSRRQTRRAVQVRVGLTLLPVLVGTLASNLTAGVVSAVAAVLLGVPLAEFLELNETGKKKMRAHIHFPAVPR